MQSVLSRSGAFRLINDMKKIVPVARIYRSLTSSQLAVLARPRYFASGPEGHIRDATDSTFSKKEKAIEDQWIRAQVGELIIFHFTFYKL